MDTSVLFHSRSGDLRGWLTERGREAATAVERVETERVLSLPVNDLADELVQRFSVEEPTVEMDARYTKGARDTKIDVTGNFGYGQRLDGGPTYTDGTEVSVHVPIRGPREAFQRAASTHTHNRPRGSVSNGELIMTFRTPSHNLGSDEERERFRDELENEMQRVEKHVAWARKDIIAFNTQLASDLEGAVERRRAKLLADRSLDSFLGIPMTPRTNPPSVSVPVRKRRPLDPVPSPPGSMRPFEPEPALSDAQVIEVVRAMVKWREGPERLPNSFSGMGEEALRDSLLIVLNGQFEWAGSEVFRRRGKTDITVLVAGPEETTGAAFVAELKVWRGKAGFGKAIDQLFGYTLWRDSICALVLLIRNKRASAVVEKAHTLLVEDPRCKRDAGNIAGQRTFVFAHPVDESKELSLVLVPVVLAND